MDAQTFQLQPSDAKNAPADPAAEAARLADLLEERAAELRGLQEELRDFKTRYAQVIGPRLSELAEVEREIRRAEARLVGEDEEEGDGGSDGSADFYASSPSPSGKTGLQKLFWSVARLFHPDHASDEAEAKRRHSIMAEASRAYSDGDVESLHTLLGDEQLQFYCASASREDEPEDLATRILNLKEELITVEFGIKRVKQDRLYQFMLTTAADAEQGRDALTQMAEQVARKIVKARNRLAHLS